MLLLKIHSKTHSTKTVKLLEVCIKMHEPLNWKSKNNLREGKLSCSQTLIANMKTRAEWTMDRGLFVKEEKKKCIHSEKCDACAEKNKKISMTMWGSEHIFRLK